MQTNRRQKDTQRVAFSLSNSHRARRFEPFRQGSPPAFSSRNLFSFPRLLYRSLPSTSLLLPVPGRRTTSQLKNISRDRCCCRESAFGTSWESFQFERERTECKRTGNQTNTTNRRAGGMGEHSYLATPGRRRVVAPSTLLFNRTSVKVTSCSCQFTLKGFSSPCLFSFLLSSPPMSLPRPPFVFSLENLPLVIKAKWVIN